jgi:type IV pilus assembly protein PilP
MTIGSGLLAIAAALALPALAAAQPNPAIAAAQDASRASHAASAGKSQPAAQGRAQQPASAPPAQVAPPAHGAAPAEGVPSEQGAAPAPAEPPAQQGFAYDPEGRRDPFVSLLGRGGTTGRGGDPAAARPTGLAGLGVNEVTMRGTVQSREGFVAILQGADQKTYIVRPGDKLYDGVVRTITPTEMVFLQQVNDPLSLEKQREVRKVLRQTEGANP